MCVPQRLFLDRHLVHGPLRLAACFPHMKQVCRLRDVSFHGAQSTRELAGLAPDDALVVVDGHSHHVGVTLQSRVVPAFVCSALEGLLRLLKHLLIVQEGRPATRTRAHDARARAHTHRRVRASVSSQQGHVR